VTEGKEKKRRLFVESPLRPWESEPDHSGADVGKIGMALFLAALTMLFGATILAYLITRANNAAQWRPEGSPDLPAVMWVSTLVILLSSVTMWRSTARLREGSQAAFRSSLLGTLVLGVAFMGLQVAGWWQLAGAGAAAGSSLYAFTFYLLTGLHAAHVLGGVIPMAFMTRWAWAGAYEDPARAGRVRLLGAYWHYLDAVWVVMFVVLFVI
jgi:cytochrome c oxidase subunit 3